MNNVYLLIRTAHQIQAIDEHGNIRLATISNPESYDQLCQVITSINIAQTEDADANRLTQFFLSIAFHYWED